MAFSATNDESNILWISTRIPAIASIYYHLHLQKSHTLYCPDDTSTLATPPVKQHVRELARNILHVIDSNDYKKLALYFMEPLSATRRDDLVRFLLKRRSRLKIYHLTLPCPLIQHYYLSAWSYSMALGLDSFWRRQCEAHPTQEFDSPSRLIPATNTYTETEFKQPFLLSTHEFRKKALFVYITQDMIILPGRKNNDELDFFEFKDTALSAIQGWIDAMSSSSSQNGNTLIFIADEASFYVGSTLQQSNQEQRKKILTHGRTQLWKKIRSMATELPIYLYLNSFNLAPNKTALPGNLAWLQQRHHLCIPHSILLTWKPYYFDPVEKTGSDYPSTSIFIQLEKVELTSVAKYNRPKWKMEFISLLQKVGNIDYTDQNYISPGKLNKDLLALETSKQHTIPLLGDEQQPFDELVHESGDFFDHSVSSLNEQVAHSWIITVQQQQQQQQQDSTIGTEYSALNTNDTKLDENDHHAIDNMTDETREEELENLADNLNHDKIRDYIANTGAYSRGEDLLHTLSQTTYSWDDEKNLLLVFAEAKGTSDKPYQVYVTLNRKNDTEVIANGYCTCPVGKTGKCKHCVAISIRFMINVDDFQQSQQQIVMPTVEQQPTTKQPSTDNEKTPPSTTIPAIATSSTVEPSPSSPHQPLLQEHLQQSSPVEHPEKQSSSSQPNTETKQPSQRRVLPWNIGEQKTGRGKKRQRSTAKNTTTGSDTAPNDSSTIHESAASVEDVEKATVKKPRRTTNKKKPIAKTMIETDSDSDTIFGDHNLTSNKQQMDKKITPRKRSARPKQPTKTTITIDDAAMWEDDSDNIKKSPSSAPVSTTAINIGFEEEEDDDDQVRFAVTPTTTTTTSQLSPLRTMQQSNLSLPMADLDLVTSKSHIVDDSDTQDEDDFPISHPHHINIPQKTSPNEQQNSDTTSTQTQQPQQIAYNTQALFQRSSTSDLFDELDL